MNHYASIFPNGIIPKQWYDMLLEPVPKMVYSFNKNKELYGLVAISKYDDAWIINSIAKDDGEFTLSMKKILLKFIRSHDKIIIMSTRKDSTVNRITDRFVNDGKLSYFIKGI